MEITGKIILALPEINGTSRAGNAWKKREYVLETQDAYPRKVFFDFFGEKVEQYPLSVGDIIRLSFDIESREYNGRWYTSVRGWKYEKVDATDAQAAQAAPTAPAQSADDGIAPPPPAIGEADENDDLPF